jgi:hypothetical protein
MEEKDKIIEILREEISLIKRMNLKVLYEKDKLIEKLKDIVQEKEDTITILKDRLKRESNIDYLTI